MAILDRRQGIRFAGTGSYSEARLKLPFKWMYECCTLTLSGLANVCSWMLLVYIENALSALGQTQSAHGQIQNQPQQQSP